MPINHESLNTNPPLPKPFQRPYPTPGFSLSTSHRLQTPRPQLRLPHELSPVRPLLAVFLASTLAFTPGCIIYDMRDHLGQTNTRLAAVQTELSQTTRLLEQANANLDTSTQTLSDIQKRLAVLDSINNSLISLDHSLKAVRAAIEKVPIVGPAAKEASPKESLPTQPSDPKP